MQTTRFPKEGQNAPHTRQKGAVCLSIHKFHILAGLEDTTHFTARQRFLDFCWLGNYSAKNPNFAHSR